MQRPGTLLIRNFGPPLFLKNQWSENIHTLTINHVYKKKCFDEKSLAFKGQEGHAEVMKTPQVESVHQFYINKKCIFSKMIDFDMKFCSLKLRRKKL